MMFFTIFHELMFWMVKRCLNVIDITPENEHIICQLWLTCKLLEILINVTLFYDKKVSFSVKVVILASVPL